MTRRCSHDPDHTRHTPTGFFAGTPRIDGFQVGPIDTEAEALTAYTLHSAAPDLLVALVALDDAATAANVIIQNVRPDGQIAYDLLAAITQARAAIRKATAICTCDALPSDAPALHANYCSCYEEPQTRRNVEHYETDAEDAEYQMRHNMTEEASQ